MKCPNCDAEEGLVVIEETLSRDRNSGRRRSRGSISAASAVQVPDLERVAALCADLPAVWAAAEPLIDRAYVDLESKTLARVAPALAFGALMGAAAWRTKRWRAGVEQWGAVG